MRIAESLYKELLWPEVVLILGPHTNYQVD